MIDGTLELPNILSIAQSLRGGDIYGKEGNYPKSMTSLTLDQRDSLGSMFINDTMMHRQDAPMFTDKMPNKPAIFIDRDNTLTRDHGYTWDIADFAWIDGAVEALQLFSDAGLDIFHRHQSGRYWPRIFQAG